MRSTAASSSPLWGVLTLIALIAGACAPGATPATPQATFGSFPLPAGLPEGDPAAEPLKAPADTAFGRELANVDTQGSIPLDSALRLFAIGIGPIPGVAVADDQQPQRSGSLAIRAVRRYWDQLSDEQRAAVDAALALPDGAQVISISAAVNAAAQPPLAAGFMLPDAPWELRRVSDADHPYTTEVVNALRDAATTVRAMIAQRMDEDIPGDVILELAPCDNNLGCAEALWGSPAGPSTVGSGAYAGCKIRITGLALSAGAAMTVNTIAHEIFHCFQASGYGSLAAASSAPAWVIEGGAEWVGNDITGDMAPEDWNFLSWFQQPATSLMQRTYDAVGFWGHLAETGTNPYDVFPFVFRTGSGPAAYRGSGAVDNQHFLDSWASSLTRREAFGRDWDHIQPGVPDVAAAPETWDIGNGDSVEMHAEPYTARVFMLNVGADVLRIAGDGHARISDGSVDTTQFSAEFCIHTDKCQPCPDSNRLPPAPLGDSPWFVITGGQTGSTFVLSGASLEEDCETPLPSPPASPDEDDKDEFCRRYIDMQNWAAQFVDTDFELSQPWAAEIARRSQDMRPFAPAHLVDDVDLYIRVYGTYAAAPEPINVPIVGPEAAGIANAFFAMNDYCGITY